MSNKENNMMEVQEAQEEAFVKPYTMRKLKEIDLWPVLDIIGKVFPDDMSKMIAVAMADADNEEFNIDAVIKQIGADVLMKLATAVIRNMGIVKDEVYAFLSDVSGVTVEEIQEMPFGTSPMMIWEIVKTKENFDFFKVVSKLL